MKCLRNDMTSKIIWSTTEFLDGRNRSSLKIIAKLDLRLSFPMFWICGIEGASTRQTIEHFSNWFGNFEWAVKMLTKFVFYLVTLNNNATKSGFTCDLTLFVVKFEHAQLPIECQKVRRNLTTFA